eukprot:TRINITY_DN54918_c1_g1_i1.p1 TRINITY_DN54918_c1_g1~~TRINITY_DN54918_c1_g1_i1.p1  ORF type:complete len:325 (-),score=29.88 TRINITY_DN54918_c1_g1_i1:90-1064(-)
MFRPYKFLQQSLRRVGVRNAQIVPRNLSVLDKSAARDPTTVSRLTVTAGQIKQYYEDGYVIVPQLFTPEEVGLISQVVTAEAEKYQVLPMSDGAGRVSKLALMNHVGKNVFGAYARSARVVDSVEKILGGEVYHYHTKFMMKEPKVGGAWNWHQDYGYWYNNSIPRPLLSSVMLAVTDHTQQNGCLRVLKGSHEMGRVNHDLLGDQAGADLERVEWAKHLFPEVAVELKAGDVLFFHCNLFHASAPNNSDGARWSLISCYNKAINDPVREHHHPCYTPMERWNDNTLLKMGPVGVTEGDGTFWLTPEGNTGTIKSDVTGETNKN